MKHLPRGTRRFPRLMAVLLLCLPLTGCQYLGFVAQAFDLSKAQPLYVLPKRNTLCFVDDPHFLLADPTLANYVGAQIGENLLYEKAIPASVPMERLNALRVKYGNEFNTLPIDRIARECGADQVIYVNIYSAQLYESPGIRHPQANMLIKVINASDGKRLYPPKDFEQAGEGVQPQPRGLPMTVSLRKSYDTDRSDRLDAATMRTLAERIARDVGRLFHEHRKEEPGEAFEEGF